MECEKCFLKEECEKMKRIKGYKKLIMSFNPQTDISPCPLVVGTIAILSFLDGVRGDYHFLQLEGGRCSIDNRICERQGPCSGCPINKRHITLEQQIVGLWNSRGVQVEEIKIRSIKKGRIEWTVVGKSE